MGDGYELEGMNMKRTSILSLLIVIGVHAAGTGAALADAGYGYGGYGNHPMMGGNWFMGPLMMLLMVGIVIVAVVVVLKIFGHRGQSGDAGTHDRALEILGERFARGEIDKAEYEERKKALDT